MYKKTIIMLIEYVENIQKAFSEGLPDKCRNLINEANSVLDAFGVEDKNTSLVRKHLNHWMANLHGS